MVSPGCTVTLAGEKAWFGAISQNGRYAGTNVPPEGTQPSVTPVQLTAGTVKCAEIQRKVRVPWEAAYPAQLADCRPVIAWVAAAAAGGLPPTTLMGVPGWKWRSRAAAGLGQRRASSRLADTGPLVPRRARRATRCAFLDTGQEAPRDKPRYQHRDRNVHPRGH